MAYASSWSLLRMKLLVMEKPEKDRPEYLRRRAHYTMWIGPDGSTSVAHLLAGLKNGFEYRRVLPLPEIPPKFIESEITFGGSGWIDGGGRPARFSPAVKGLAIWNVSFAPPKPAQHNWVVLRSAIFAGFHRAWPYESKIETASITCGKPEVVVWRAK